MGMNKQELAQYARRIAEAQKRTVKNREPWIAIELATNEATSANTDEAYATLAAKMRAVARTQPANDAWGSIAAVSDELAGPEEMAPEPETAEAPRRRRRRAAEPTEGEPAPV